MAVYDRSAGKKTTSLTINSDLVRKAKEAGINASQVAEEALAERLEKHVRETWDKAARVEIAAYNAYIEEHGLFADLTRRNEQGETADGEAI